MPDVLGPWYDPFFRLDPEVRKLADEAQALGDAAEYQGFCAQIEEQTTNLKDIAARLGYTNSRAPRFVTREDLDEQRARILARHPDDDD